MAKHAKSHKGRKIGRNRIKCERYRLQHRREKNKIKRISKHLKVHINDQLARQKLIELQKYLDKS